MENGRKGKTPSGTPGISEQRPLRKSIVEWDSSSFSINFWQSSMYDPTWDSLSSLRLADISEKASWYSCVNTVSVALLIQYMVPTDAQKAVMATNQITWGMGTNRRTATRKNGSKDWQRLKHVSVVAVTYDILAICMGVRIKVIEKTMTAVKSPTIEPLMKPITTDTKGQRAILIHSKMFIVGKSGVRGGAWTKGKMRIYVVTKMCCCCVEWWRLIAALSSISVLRIPCHKINREQSCIDTTKNENQKMWCI